MITVCLTSSAFAPDMTDNFSVFDQLLSLLSAQGVTWSVLEHEPVYTSEQAAEVRGTSLSSGAKALICKADQEFRLFVMPANRRLATKQVRTSLKIRRLRFATADEVLELTGLRPGSIPPFGSLFSLPTCCDESLSEETVINFNAGDHARSISMTFADYCVVENPTRCSIASFSDGV